MIGRFCLALAAVASCASTAQGMESYAVGTVEVREAPTEESRVRGLLSNGVGVVLRRCEDGWCLIGDPVGDGWGWVREDDLRLRGGGV